MKKIPYGIADYKRIVEDNYYFVDKTKFIEQIENLSEPYVIFLRPRRFGKSLFLALLDAYYSIEYKDDFDLLFSKTYIGKNPTKEKNSYYVLKFDFSGVGIENIEDRFKKNLSISFENFVYKFKLDIKLEEDPKDSFENILQYFTKYKDKKLFILIDEYDHFANRVLLQNKQDYKNIITDKTAFFKEFFTTLKTATTGNDSPLKRMFITGVTPMTMYDVTSGFNIGSNISLNKNFNDLVGFTQNEVEELLRYYEVDVDINLLKEWYNNYIFSDQMPQPIFNTDMILYFINQYLANDNRPPEEMIDINVRSDYSKLRNILYTNKKLNGNFDTLRTLIAGDSVSIQNLVQDFSALHLEDENNFKSLMFYLGLVTIKNKQFQLNLTIPNETIKRIDIDFLRDTLKLENMFNLQISKLEDKFQNFALNGDIEIFEYLAKQIYENSSIRDYIYKEQHIKSMYLAYLSLTPYYIVKSELELNKGFADILIKPFNNEYIKYFGMLEFKYINRDEKPTKDKIDKLREEAILQLEKYQDDKLLQPYLKNELRLKKILLIFHGWELIKLEEIK